MAEKKQERIEVLTPRGTFIWPKLTGAPDTKFKPEGEYAVRIRLAGDDAQKLLDKIEEAKAMAIAECLEKSKIKDKKKAAEKIAWLDMPFKEEVDEETGDETGYWLFNFKMKASGVNKKTQEKWTRKPTLFDGKRNPIKGNIKIGTGSEGKVFGYISPVSISAEKAGIGLKLDSVQILKLVGFGGKSAEQCGFEEEEDGYTFSPEDAAPEEPAEQACDPDDADAEGDF